MSGLTGQEINASDVSACGHFVGNTLYWDINGESVSDDDLRRWIRNHFPEDSSWGSTACGIVAYHTVAYANRRRAISDLMKTVKWSGREVSP